MALVLGLDIGTTSTVGVLMDADGRIVVSAARDTTLSSPAPGHAEEDPAQWWTNALSILAELATAAPPDNPLRGLCVTGMLPAVVLLDANDRLLRPSIQQSDSRCGREVVELQAEIDDDAFLKRTGQGLTQQLVAPKLRWLARHEPEMFKRIATVFGSYDYVNWRLTGRRTVDRNWALEAGFIDLSDDRIAADLVALAGIARSAIPETIASHEQLGLLTDEVARLTGLPTGLPVFGGAADHIASALSAGLTQAGDVLLKFGGAGDVIAVSAAPKPDRRLYLDYHLIPGLYAPNGCMAASGSTLRWLATFLGHDATSSAFAALDGAAAAIAPGSDGVRVLPYFLGEKTPIHDPRARGSFTGLSLNHGPGHAWRATLEAIACGYRHHLDVLADMGQPALRLFASDGGSRSRVWMQIVADMTGRPVRLLRDTLGSAVGAGWVALAGADIVDWPEIGARIVYGETVEPNPTHRAAYDRVYTDYHALYGALRPFFSRPEAAG
jgi:xylulokinase